jgi:hypothetical protein
LSFVGAAIVISVLWLASNVGAGGPAETPTPRDWGRALGHMDANLIRESSGIDKSDQYDGIYWTHSDSGNTAELFAVRLDGTIVARIPVFEAINLDWEDIAVDGGFIYVGDIGNNFGLLSTRTIYQFVEPNPNAAKIQPIKPVKVVRYQFPAAAFDAESLIVRGESLWVIRKAGPGASTLFKLVPTNETICTLAPVQELREVGLTGADLSPDGRSLAVTSTWLLGVYPVNEDLTFRAGEKPLYVRYPFGGGVEACCFDGEDVIVTAESGAIHRVPRHIIDTQRPFEPRQKPSSR